MKKNMYVVLAAITLVIVMVSGAFAAGVGSPKTANVNASATIANVCAVSGTGTLSFGSLDALTNSGAVNITDSGTLSIMCTMGASVTVTDDLGSNEVGAQMKMNCTGAPCTPGTDLINYSIAYTSGLTGNGITSELANAANLNLRATIGAGALNNVPAGGYSDVIQLTIAY